MKVFTTGQVAKICKVAPRTVSKWFDSGRLKGYRIPGSQDRRIPREYLIKFLKEHGMPLGDLEDGFRILVVTADDILTSNLKKELDDSAYGVTTAASGFEVGSSVECIEQHCVVVDFSIGKEDAISICEHLRSNVKCENIKIIALIPEAIVFDRSLVNETYQKPVESAKLAKRISAMLEDSLDD